MSVSPTYENYEYIADGPVLKSQSIVECRLADWSENRILAVSPNVVCGEAEVLPGEVRYGGKLFFSVVAAAPDGTLVAAERGVEFTHRAECESAAPAQRADVSLCVEKTERRLEGRSVIVSAIVTATIRLRVPVQMRYLSGGEGVVCNFAPVRLPRSWQCSGTAELEEEFDTDYVSDVLLHSEQVYVTRAVCAAGCLDVSGEVNLGVLAGKAGEKEAVSYERIIPFRAEIPCDEAVTGMACRAEASVVSVSLTCACDEEKGRCRILAQINVEIRGRVSRAEELQLPQDAFCLGHESVPATEKLSFEEPVCAFTAAERVSGTAAIDGNVDPNCSLQAAALCGVQIAATVSDGEIEAEGVLSAAVFFKDGEGNPKTVNVSLPFAFPVRCDRARQGMRAEVTAIACGVSARQLRAGELDAEGSLKLYVTLYVCEESRYVCELTVGEERAEEGGAVGVYFPAAGDTLWETAKKLGKTAEEVQSCNPDLKFPLTGAERIVVWRRKKLEA